MKRSLMKFFYILLCLSWAVLPKVYSVRQPDVFPQGFVYLDEVDPTIEQHLLFATPDNLVGTVLDGYEKGRVICTREAAVALKGVQKELKGMGYCLRIDDAYRPVRAVDHIKRWAKDLTDQKTKHEFYPNIDKRDLAGKFIAARRSSHSRGSTVDVTILNDETKEELDFGPQTLGAESSPHATSITPQQRRNRLLLRDVMMRHGFKPYHREWWHFTLKKEPFPKTYFDFPVK